jgi:hypothetical protein
MQEYLATLDTYIFQKKKKKKRKPSVQVEGFKKANFSEKILPNEEVFRRQFLVFSAMR